MGSFLKLLCGSNPEREARAYRPSHRASATASGQTIYTHLTTLFEDNEGLYSFYVKFRHDNPHPRDSVRKYLVPASSVLSYKRMEPLYHSLPSKYRTSLVQRIHLYDDCKPLFAHLTTVFREERALFSFYLEFQDRSKGRPKEMEHRHPQHDQIIYVKEMDPVVTNLAGYRVPTRMSLIQFRSRSQSQIANDTSAALGEEVPTARSSEPARRWYSETARPAQRPPLDRSMSAAAARTALYGSDGSQRASGSSRTGQRMAESVSYLSGTARVRESSISANTTQHTETPNRDIVCASTEAHLDLETRRGGNLDPRNRITRLERHSSTDLRRENIEHEAPERTPRHGVIEPWESTHDHTIQTINERSKGRSRTRGSHRSSQLQERHHSATTDTPEGRPDAVDHPLRSIMSPTTELLHNPFAESPPRRDPPESPLASRERAGRSRASSTDSYERPRPRTSLRQSSILERSPRAEPRDRTSHHVHFDLGHQSTEDLNRAYDNTSSSPRYRFPRGEHSSSSPRRSRSSSQSTRQPTLTPAAPAPSDTCKTCKTMRPGIDMKGYCSHCWVHVDPAEKLLCGRCFETFTARHEDSREVLTMCEACYEAVPGVVRERERMRGLGMGFDKGV